MSFGVDYKPNAAMLHVGLPVVHRCERGRKHAVHGQHHIELQARVSNACALPLSSNA